MRREKRKITLFEMKLRKKYNTVENGKVFSVLLFSSFRRKIYNKGIENTYSIVQ